MATSALAPIREEIATVKQAHPDPLLDGHPLGSDRVRDALAEVLGDRIGAPRYKQKQAPGWKDAEKPEPDRYGDLATWLDAVERAKVESRPLILVTEERKEDWWWERAGELIGPRPELIEEVRNEAGQDFYLANLTQFMEEGATALELELSEEEREDVARTQQPEPVLKRERWWGNIDESYRKLPSYWSPTVAVDPTGATMTVRLEPDAWIEGPQFLPVSKHICVLEEPSGNVSFAVKNTSDFVVALRFPDDFEETGKLEPGRYSYRWFRTHEEGWEGPWPPSGEVLKGAFEIPTT